MSSLEDKNKSNSHEENGNKKSEPHEIFLNLSRYYLVDLECLREMFSSVLPVLQGLDESRVKRINSIFQKGKKESEGKVKFKFNLIEGKQLVLDLEKLRRSENLFRREAIVSIVSRFDEFLGSILKIVFQLNPDWLKTNSKTLTYKELIELKSVESAITGVIEKEVEDLMRGSKEEQIEFIDSKLKLGIKDKFLALPSFLEVAERRNLCVHTGCRVSQQYLERCKKFNFQYASDLKIGSLVDITDKYFSSAVELYFEAGLRISQAIYRRIFPTHLIEADKKINNLAVKFLESADWSIAELISNFYLSIPPTMRVLDDEFEHFAFINRAIAQKHAGKDFETGLKAINWSVLHPKYSLALCVLREQNAEAAKLMLNQAVIEGVEESGFRTWPLFTTFRNTKEFDDTYRKVFGHTFKLTEDDMRCIMSKNTCEGNSILNNEMPVSIEATKKKKYKRPVKVASASKITKSVSRSPRNAQSVGKKREDTVQFDKPTGVK